jgi:ABC-type xylose transport system substrate-binding protein
MRLSVLAPQRRKDDRWSNFQEERWKTDEGAIKAALEAAGAAYISTDAQSSAAKQLSDVESLIAQGVDALIILAQDARRSARPCRPPPMRAFR